MWREGKVGRERERGREGKSNGHRRVKAWQVADIRYSRGLGSGVTRSSVGAVAWRTPQFGVGRPPSLFFLLLFLPSPVASFVFLFLCATGSLAVTRSPVRAITSDYKSTRRINRN